MHRKLVIESQIYLTVNARKQKVSDIKSKDDAVVTHYPFLTKGFVPKPAIFSSFNNKSTSNQIKEEILSQNAL
jgi:hypothetical protein